MGNNCIPDAKGESVGLLMTYRCNLDCKYCYIRQKQDRDMTFGMAKSILKSFLFDEDSGWLDVIFVGGETLLAFDVIKQIVEWAESLQTKRSFRFFGSTNGTLLNEEMKRWLSNHSSAIILGLSYDGLPSTQIENRSKDSIDLEFFINTWPKQPIQMTIDAESVKHVAEGVIYLLEKGAVVHPNVAFEENDWPEESILEYGNQLAILIDYYNSHEGLPMISQFVHNLKAYADSIDHPFEQPQICGAGNGYQVFDTDGTSYPCHILSPLVLRGEKLENVKCGSCQSVKDYSDSRCTGCPYTSACPTCIASNYLYRGALQSRDWTHCQIMKTEVQAYMKKEVLRMSAKESLSPEDATQIDAICRLTEYEEQAKKGQ